MSLKNNFIKLSNCEIQSGTNRVQWAEGLIEQLPKNHDGRNSWLLNYGVKYEAGKMRKDRGLMFIPETDCCETTGGKFIYYNTGEHFRLKDGRIFMVISMASDETINCVTEDGVLGILHIDAVECKVKKIKNYIVLINNSMEFATRYTFTFKWDADKYAKEHNGIVYELEVWREVK